MVVCPTYKEKPMKPKDLPLFTDIDISNSELTNAYENQNSWLIEIIINAAENYGFGRTAEYEKKILLLKNSPFKNLSRKDLLWLADKFARVFARVQYRCDYHYYFRYFFAIYFGKEKKKYPDNLFWHNAPSAMRLEKRALERPNPEHPIFFHSGNSALSDFRGYLMAKNSIGVQIQLCFEHVRKLMLDYNSQDGRLFVDNGSFSCFRKDKQVDFDKVLRAYLELVENAQKPELLSLVAPDVVGNQQASLELLKQYKKQLFKLVCLGVDLIVPIQLGNLSLEEAYKEAVTTLGTKAFRVGLPSNEKAIALETVLEFVSIAQPKSIHFLGLAITKFDNVVDKIKAVAPQTHISADATTLRAKLKKGSKLASLIEAKTKQALEALSTSANPYQALFNGIFHKPSFLSENQAKHLAKLLSPIQQEQERIVSVALSGITGLYNGSRLGDLLEKYYGTKLINEAIEILAETLSRRAVSGQIRAAAIAQIQQLSA